MNENEPLKPIQRAPLNMLVRFDRRKRVVAISTQIVSRLNVSLLEQTIRFGLNHSFKTTIEGRVERKCRAHDSKDWFYAELWICPDPSDWPEPCEMYAKLYCAAICLAAAIVDKKEDPEGFCRPRIVEKQYGMSPMSPFLSTVQFGYDFAVPANGAELLRVIKRRLDLIRDELPMVTDALATGPIPGTTPQENS